MRGSWAGAMGQPQFMPSNFDRLAVDFDGDGRRDIWDSRADALGSIANYFQRNGWREGEPWGREVAPAARLHAEPAPIPRPRRPLRDFNRLGFRSAGGGAAAGRGLEAAVVLPCARGGPGLPRPSQLARDPPLQPAGELRPRRRPAVGPRGVMRGAPAAALAAAGAAARAAGRPRYLVGEPYQLGGVWSYPREDFALVETGLADAPCRAAAGRAHRQWRDLRPRPR